MKTKLFSPIRIRDITFDNRIVVSPMVQFSAEDEGNASDWHLMHLGNLSVSGAGLVFTEATAVEPRGVVSAHCLGLWSDENMHALERVIRFCRKHSPAKMGIQLQHAGRKGSVTKPWEKQVGLKAGEGGWVLRAPSAVPYPGRKEVPEEILQKGQADMVALARGMLFNPRWPWLAAQMLGEEAYYAPQYERCHPSMLRGDFLKPYRDKVANR